MSAPLLEVRGLVKRFGALVATDGVDLDVHAGEIHALIGPNGAGKTTLVAQLGGQLASDAGRIVFAGRDIARLAPHGRAALGLVRSFQITRLFAGATVHEHAALAVQAIEGRHFAAWRPSREDRPLAERADALLGSVGLLAKRAHGVGALSHGERRALDVAMALAGRPRLVLLDEPMAGLGGGEESARMERLVAALRASSAVLLVEHDVDAVFRLADRVSVLVEGRLVASGAPDSVRRDPAVIAAYLGEAAA